MKRRSVITKNALKRFGLAAILLRLITIAMHLLVICKVLPYTWVSGGQITDYNTAVTTAGASIVILLTSMAIYHGMLHCDQIL